MAATEYSRLTRRTVLTGAAAMLAAGVAAAPGTADAADPAPAIRSAAARGEELLVLTDDGDPAEVYAIRRLVVDAERRAGLGRRLPVEFPDGFHPHSIAARGRTLWVTGSVDELVKTITVDNRSDAPGSDLGSLRNEADPMLPDAIVDIAVHRARPALLRIEEERAAFVEFPVPGSIRSGAATAVALPGERGLAVAVEGCPDAGLAMITRSHLALSSDEGRTWRYSVLAEGLGEGYGTVLAAVGGRVFAVTADGAGTQTMRTGEATRDAALELVATEAGAGRPMAAVPTAEGEVDIFSDRDGRVGESRFGRGGRVGGTDRPDCGCAGEIVAIRGRPGAWLEIDADTVRVHGL